MRQARNDLNHPLKLAHRAWLWNRKFPQRAARFQHEELLVPVVVEVVIQQLQHDQARLHRLCFAPQELYPESITGIANARVYYRWRLSSVTLAKFARNASGIFLTVAYPISQSERIAQQKDGPPR